MKGDREKLKEIPLFPLNPSQAEINYQAADYFKLASWENNKQLGINTNLSIQLYVD